MYTNYNKWGTHETNPLIVDSIEETLRGKILVRTSLDVLAAI